MPFNLGPTELIIILVIVLIVFGVGRLPEIGGALGKSIREFRQNSGGDDAKKAKPVEGADAPNTDKPA
jgi:sec-independent protein translocase protein TatA